MGTVTFIPKEIKKQILDRTCQTRIEMSYLRDTISYMVCHPDRSDSGVEGSDSSTPFHCTRNDKKADISILV
ncbi:MAG: hypothetical protein AAB600_03285 [Patescibacteria group bacterium]